MIAEMSQTDMKKSLIPRLTYWYVDSPIDYLVNEQTASGSNPTPSKAMIALDSFLTLEKNWNGYGAKPLDQALVDRVRQIIKYLTKEPRVIPGSYNNIQLEYKKPNGDYLEIEISNDVIEILQKIGPNEEERDITQDQIFEIERDFNR